MGQVAETITQAATRGLGLAEALLKGVTPETFARQPVNGGELILTNHPAFAYGHLSLYPAKIIAMGGGDPGEATAPEGFEGLFSHQAQCLDDPGGTIYPAMDEVVSCFQTGYAKALEFVGTLDDDALAKDHNGPEAYRKFFPGLGLMVNFMLTSHVMVHMGQVSAWRRCMGLGSAM